MSFADLLQTDLDALLSSDQFEEEVGYRSVNASGTGAVTTIKAFVEEDTPETPLQLGVSASGEHQIIVVTVSKTDVPCINVKHDRVCWKEETFGVKRILREDPAGWRLYCVR